MTQIEVKINDRTYQVACADGEEQHLTDLADYVDRKIGELTETLGQVGETRLMLMAGLVIADELADTMDKLEAAQEAAADASQRSRETDQDQAVVEAAAKTLNSAAQRIEHIAADLERT